MKNIRIIVQIAILILELIKKGLDETEIIINVIKKFNVTEDFVKSHLKK